MNVIFYDYKHEVDPQVHKSAIQNDSVELFPFTDSSYSVKLRILSGNNESQQVCIELLFKKRLLSADTVSSLRLEFELEDMNNDGVSDLLILQTVHQSNPSYYLYIVDTSTHRLHYVSGFEKVFTPQLEKDKNVIVSYLRSGTEMWYDFYKLSKHYKLLNLGLGFKTSDENSADKQYNATLRKIRK